MTKGDDRNRPSPRHYWSPESLAVGADLAELALDRGIVLRLAIYGLAMRYCSINATACSSGSATARTNVVAKPRS